MWTLLYLVLPVRGIKQGIKGQVYFLVIMIGI